MDDITEFDQFYRMWRDEMAAHRTARVIRNVAVLWAVVMTMLAVFLLWYAAGFTYVEPDEIITEITTTADDGSNAIITTGDNSGVNVDGRGSED